MLKRACSLLFVVPLLLFATPASSSAGPNANAYGVAKLVSDVPGMAAHLDPAWSTRGVWSRARPPRGGSPNNGTDRSTLYDGTGGAIPLVVTVGGAPTGTVFNGGSGFVVTTTGRSGPSLFLFATEAGTIRGWNPGVPGRRHLHAAFMVVEPPRRGGDLQGPRDRDPRRGRPALRDRLPQRPRRCLRRAVPPGAARSVPRPEPARGLRAVRDPGRSAGHLRHLREAGRRRRG